MVEQILAQIEAQFGNYTNFLKKLEKYPNVIPSATPFVTAEIVFLKDLLDPFYEPTIKNLLKRLLDEIKLSLYLFSQSQIIFTLSHWLPDPAYYKLTVFLFPKDLESNLNLPKDFPVFIVAKNSE